MLSPQSPPGGIQRGVQVLGGMGRSRPASSGLQPGPLQTPPVLLLDTPSGDWGWSLNTPIPLPLGPISLTVYVPYTTRACTEGHTLLLLYHSLLPSARTPVCTRFTCLPRACLECTPQGDRATARSLIHPGRVGPVSGSNRKKK